VGLGGTLRGHVCPPPLFPDLKKTVGTTKKTEVRQDVRSHPRPSSPAAPAPSKRRMWDPEPELPAAPPTYHAHGGGGGARYALTGAEFEQRNDEWRVHKRVELDAAITRTAGYRALREAARVRELYAAAVVIIATFPLTAGLIPGLGLHLGLGSPPRESGGTAGAGAGAGAGRFSFSWNNNNNPDARGPVARLLAMSGECDRWGGRPAGAAYHGGGTAAWEWEREVGVSSPGGGELFGGGTDGYGGYARSYRLARAPEVERLAPAIAAALGWIGLLPAAAAVVVVLVPCCRCATRWIAADVDVDAGAGAGRGDEQRRGWLSRGRRRARRWWWHRWNANDSGAAEQPGGERCGDDDGSDGGYGNGGSDADDADVDGGLWRISGSGSRSPHLRAPAMSSPPPPIPGSLRFKHTGESPASASSFSSSLSWMSSPSPSDSSSSLRFVVGLYKLNPVQVESSLPIA
jgi:hypothetical protein